MLYQFTRPLNLFMIRRLCRGWYDPWVVCLVFPVCTVDSDHFFCLSLSVYYSWNYLLHVPRVPLKWIGPLWSGLSEESTFLQIRFWTYYSSLIGKVFSPSPRISSFSTSTYLFTPGLILPGRFGTTSRTRNRSSYTPGVLQNLSPLLSDRWCQSVLNKKL